MTTYPEYAALARHLDHLTRTGEAATAGYAQRHHELGETLDQLDQRLAVQQEQLAQLGRLIGQHMSSRPVAPAVPVPAPAPIGGPAGGPGHPPGMGDPAVAIPHQRSVAGGAADPAHSAELARQSADAADAAATEADALARQATLLPKLSPLARNLVVYAASALVAVAVQFYLLTLSNSGPVDAFAVAAWMCAGLPAAAFFAGYLVLATWGKPKIAQGNAAIYPKLGFAVCFLAMPAVYCGYKLIVQLL